MDSQIAINIIESESQLDHDFVPKVAVFITWTGMRLSGNIPELPTKDSMIGELLESNDNLEPYLLICKNGLQNGASIVAQSLIRIAIVNATRNLQRGSLFRQIISPNPQNGPPPLIPDCPVEVGALARHIDMILGTYSQIRAEVDGYVNAILPKVQALLMLYNLNPNDTSLRASAPLYARYVALRVKERLDAEMEKAAEVTASWDARGQD